MSCSGSGVDVTLTDEAVAVRRLRCAVCLKVLRPRRVRRRRGVRRWIATVPEHLPLGAERVDDERATRENRTKRAKGGVR